VDIFFIVDQVFFPFPTPQSQRTQKENLWGWVAGVGLAHELSQYLSAFLEYTHYDYGKPSSSFGDLDVHIFDFSPRSTQYTQHVRITANAIRVGLNVKFEF